MQDAHGTPTTFFAGLGRASYHDSCSWAQKLCSVKGGESRSVIEENFFFGAEDDKSRNQVLIYGPTPRKFIL